MKMNFKWIYKYSNVRFGLEILYNHPLTRIKGEAKLRGILEILEKLVREFEGHMRVFVRDQKPRAVENVAVRYDQAEGVLPMEEPTLYIYRTNLARGIPGSNHLVWEVAVGNGNDIREFVY